MRHGLNSHQLIKVFALVIMTIDHVGAFWFPEQLWWRAIGRVTFPVWFFLIGHALHYTTTRELWRWALLLAVVSPFLGVPIFPLNALFTIILCQHLLRLNLRRDFLTNEFTATMLCCLLFLLPSLALSEYGMIGVLYAFMGYMVREGTLQSPKGILLALISYGTFVGTQLGFMFDFTRLQAVFVLVVTGLVTVLLARFTHRPVAIPAMLRGFEPSIQWLSRHSLQYYVVHRVVMQAVGILIGTLRSALRLM